MLDYTKILVECVCAGHVLGVTSVVKQASKLVLRLTYL